LFGLQTYEFTVPDQTLRRILRSPQLDCCNLVWKKDILSVVAILNYDLTYFLLSGITDSFERRFIYEGSKSLDLLGEVEWVIE
jgi:hypothetical protein